MPQMRHAPAHVQRSARPSLHFFFSSLFKMARRGGPTLLIPLVLVLALLLVLACGVGAAAAARRTGPRRVERFDGAAHGTKKEEGVVEEVQGTRYRIGVVDTGTGGVDVGEMGKCISLDGRMQLCEADAHRYHEMLVHFAVAYLGADRPPRRVLIVGGGDCLALREVLKYGTVERVVVLEDEEKLPSVAEKHLLVNAHRTDPRVKWVHGNVAASAKKLAEGGSADQIRAYDVILLDCKARPGATPVTRAMCDDLLALLAVRGVVSSSCVGASAALGAAFPYSVPYSFHSDTLDASVGMTVYSSFNIAAKPDDTPAAKGEVDVSFYEPSKHAGYLPWVLRAAGKVGGGVPRA